jgi:hypothetical protein
MDIIIRLNRDDLKEECRDIPIEELDFSMFHVDINIVRLAHIILYKDNWNNHLERRFILKSRYREEDIHHYLNF